MIRIAFRTKTPTLRNHSAIDILGRISTRNYSSKYGFYDLLLETESHPRQPIEALLMTEKELEDLKKTTNTVFEGKYNLNDMTAEQKIAMVFGGRIKGDARQSSSRMNVGQPRVIAGIKVPDKPLEPDNCCMSGCINCVWEMYNDDVKEWNAKRKEAAVKLGEKGGVWPEDFHPPVQFLNDENLPESIRKNDGRSLDKETWGNVPVQIRVFAETERRLREKKKSKSAVA